MISSSSAGAICADNTTRPHLAPWPDSQFRVRSRRPALIRAEGDSPARRYGFLTILLFVTGASLAAEWRSLIRPDTGFLLDAAQRVLGGERLYVDVVEINPPLIVWLNMGAVAFARTLGVSAIVVYRLGVVAVLAVSLVVSAGLLRRALPGNARARGDA